MALADYYLCDLCGRKTFYDANLHYEQDPREEMFNENPDTHHPWPVGAGDMIVICTECAKSHRVVIVRDSDNAVIGEQW